MSAEGMVSRFAHVIPGYVQRNYGYLRARHCLYDVDDLIQIAMIELMTLSKTWQPNKVPESRQMLNRMFFHDLKWNVSDAIKQHRKKVEPGDFPEDSVDRTYVDSDESVLLPRLSINQKTDTPDAAVSIGNVIDHYNTLPLRRKVTLTLRFVDELTYGQIAELVERVEAVVRAEAAETMETLRNFARNQYTDHAVDVHQFRTLEWEPGELLETYVRSRHQMDVRELVGYFVIMMRADPVLLARMLDTASVHVRGGSASRIRTDLQQMVDARLAEGMTQAAIARELNVSPQTVWNYAHRESAGI